ncbi:MAG: hypothetical protein N7Q72_01220 [Spiroplasma sp. Tabriz.8]|nr:hypothetical protein [Spiroplasma sp. Tabriz.8]
MIVLLNSRILNDNIYIYIYIYILVSEKKIVKIKFRVIEQEK